MELLDEKNHPYIHHFQKNVVHYHILQLKNSGSPK